MEWVTIQPDGRVGAAFGWYELVGGLIVPRHGLVTVPLPDGGRILATRRSFVAERAAAAQPRTGHPALITVRVGVRGGDFVLGFYDRRTEVVDGADLAAALATVPLYQANLRMWLSWPEPEAERRRMRVNLALLADATGATVWAPAEPGATAMLDGCLDLAVDPDGRPAWWQSYGQPGQFESDVDGRLVPIGGVDVAGTPGIPLVSGHRGQPRLEPTAWPGFACHLPILPGGRIGMRYADGTLLAIGPRQFAQSLRDHGWFWPGRGCSVASNAGAGRRHPSASGRPDRAARRNDHDRGRRDIGSAALAREAADATIPAAVGCSHPLRHRALRPRPTPRRPLLDRPMIDGRRGSRTMPGLR